MSIFDQARDKLKDAVGEVAEGNVDDLRSALTSGVQDALAAQMEDLLGKAVVAAMSAVREELQTFAALQLATKDDIARLESLIVSTGAWPAAGGQAAQVRTSPARPARPATPRVHATTAVKVRRQRTRLP